jgi:predicted heme/steroid binding protein
MARISTYPILSTPTVNDLLIGTDVENFNDTKNFSIGAVGDLFFNFYVPYVGAIGNVDLGIYGITGGYFAVQGGTEFQFLKADGTLDSTFYTPESRTLTINGVTYDLTEDRTWTISLIDTLTTIGTGGAATLTGSVLNVPIYQSQGNYITSLTGEASGSGPGAAEVTLLNAAVIAKILTGLNITGGTVTATDTILQAFGKLQNQVNGLFGGVTYEGMWNAATNTPTLTSGEGTKGYYYVVNVAGDTNLDGITSWNVGDWAIFNGDTWDKVDNTDAVISVNGYTGAVELTYSDVGAVPDFRTITINGTGYNLTADRSWTVGDVRTDSSYANPSWITSLGWNKIINTPTTLAGYGITDAVEDSTTLTINGTSYDLSANRSWSVGTITSISTIAPLTGGTITTTGSIGITQAGAAMDGYLSAEDWIMFDAKQNFMTANAPLLISGDVISISQAGVSSNGYLSSTDWNTFNNKQNALTNPVTGTGTVYYIPMWTGVTALGDSIISYASGVTTFNFNNAEGASVVFNNTATTAYAYSVLMNNVTRNTFHTYTDGNVIQQIGANQVSRVFQNGNTIIGTGTVNNGYKLEVGGTTNIIGDLTSSNSPEWDAAYEAKINSAEVTGTTTKTLTLNRQDGGTVTASWTDYDTAPVTSVFGRLGAVVAEAGDYSTTLVTEGTNLYYLDSRARAAISSSATGLTYTTLTGVLSLTAGYSIPTNASQLTWDSAYNNMIVSAAVTGTTTKTLTLNQQDGGTITATWSDYDTAPVTSVFGRTGDIIAQSGDYSTTLVTEGTNLYFTESRARASISSSATGLTYTTATGVLSLTSGYAIPTTASQVTWDNAYDNMIVSAAVTGTTTKTLTLNQQDGGNITASWTDYDTAPVTSVFGRLGAVVAESGDYSTTLVTEGTNLYYTDTRARLALSAGAGINYNTTTGVIASTITQYTDALARASISLTTVGVSGAATYNNTTGVLNIPQYTDQFVGTVTSVGLSAPTGFAVSNSPVTSSGTLTLAFASGYSLPTNAIQANWTTAYNDSIISAAVTGVETKTLTLNQQDGGTITATWSDYDTAPVTSVFGRIGAITAQSGDYNTSQVTENTNLYFTNSRARQAISLTTTGTSGAATYDNGTGVFNIPNYGAALIGYVPYTGATQSVNLGEFGVTAGFVGFDLTPTGTPSTPGTMFWSSDDETVDIIMDAAVTQKIGQETFYLVKNQTGTAIPKGSVVRADGTVGASGRILIAPFLANGTVPSNFCIGVTAETIADGADGFVTAFGKIRGVNTASFPNGTILYASPTSAGGFTATAPQAPNNIVTVAIVINSSTSNGVLFVRPNFGSNINQDEGVKITSPVLNQGLFYNGGYWVNKTIASALGYTPANAATTLTINGQAYDLSANRTWSVGTVTSVDVSVPTGFAIAGNPITTAGTLALTFAAGYSLPTNASQTNWDTAYTNRITSLTTTGTSGAATLSSNVLNIPIYQAQGNYITSLTGEATASGPGAASVTLTNSAVTGKVLTGLTVAGSSITSTDSILAAFGKLQGQVNDLIGGLQYQGTWDASTNTPAITSGVGTDGHFYIVSVAGNTTIDGVSGWQVGDWIVFHSPVWQKVDNTESVVSVNGFTGAVNLTTSNISEGTNLYFTNSRARTALSLTTTGNSGAATYDNGTGVFNIPQYTLSGLGGVPTTRSLTINGTAFDLSADRTWNVGTVTSIATSGPITGGTITGSGTIGITQSSSTTNGFLSSTDWNTFNNKQSTISLTTTGNSGASTFASNTLNVPNYTLGGLGGVPTSRTLTINGVGFDLSADRSWSVGTLTGSGTVNYLPKWDGSTSLTNSLLFDSGAGIGIGTASINASALFQMDSTTKGFLPPRMTAAQRGAISSPAQGLIVYQVDSVIGLYIYSNSVWRSLTMV